MSGGACLEPPCHASPTLRLIPRPPIRRPSGFPSWPCGRTARSIWTTPARRSLPAPSVSHALAHHRLAESRAQLAGVARRKASQQVGTELRARGERLLNDLHAIIHESADPERIVEMAAALLRSALHATRCIGLLAA